MIADLDATIAAIASAPGGAARGIIRISGPKAVACLMRCFAPNDADGFVQCRRPQAFTGELTTRAARRGEVNIPCEVFLWPGERSYTREPSAELHTFGSPPILNAVLDAVCRAGARLAINGEFTLRAFLAGRIDLVQAEAVLGVVDAVEDVQLQTALQQLAGGMSRTLNTLRDELVALLAELEAGLDFAEEEIEFIAPEELARRLHEAGERVRALESQVDARAEFDATFRVVLAGPPNAGKSRLFNALRGRFGMDAAAPRDAIVSDTPGTTRDALAARVHLGGHDCELWDTAGVDSARAAAGIELAAERQSANKRGEADIVLQCAAIDAGHHAKDFVSATRRTIPVIHVATKSDLRTDCQRSDGAIRTSALTGDGVAELAAEIARRAETLIAPHGASVAATAQRCRESLRGAADALDRATRLATAGEGDELVAEEMRHALHALGLVVGAVYTDDILDHIFSSFCIGK